MSRMGFGIVAENSAVVRSAGMAAMMSSTSSWKPISSIWSASSSTSIRTWLRSMLRAVDVVDQAARRGDDDVDAAVERAQLAVDGLAAVDRQQAQTAAVAEAAEMLGDLDRELARRGEDHRLDVGRCPGRCAR